MISIEHYLNFFGGPLAFLLFFVASIRLFLVHKSAATITFLVGMLAALGGLLGQWVALIMSEPEYVMDSDKIVGVVGPFSNSYQIASSVFYLGLLVASAGIVWHTFSQDRAASR